MRRSFPFVVAAFAVLLIPVALFARQLDPEFRSCMQQAVQTNQSALAESQRQFDSAFESAMDQRRQGYVDSWSNEDDRAQYDAQRAADKAFNDQVDNLRKEQRTREDQARKTWDTDQRVCNDNRYRKERACQGGDFVCKTGQRFPRCTQNGAVIDYFGNPCDKVNPPPQCNDIICPNGKHYPTCTANGAIIDYFRNPCEPVTPPPDCGDIVCPLTGQHYPKCSNGTVINYFRNPCQPLPPVDPPRPVPPGQQCGSAMCGAGQHCACVSPCSPGVICIQICIAKCVN